ncbi:MAG: ImmA/IrrE family metallo-endopeptidase [Syntrophomonadaceae bacterium]|nr:ImmA/IrrE family metallo-endopeptidase [Syntrophomonadaceae bacterium]
MANINVSPGILQWAVERSDKLKAVMHKFPKWSEWLSGESNPTLKQLESLAKFTSTPLGYFFLNEPPIEGLPIPHFRTIHDDSYHIAPSPELLDTVQMMERRQKWLHEYLADQKYDFLKFVGSKSINDNPIHIAKAIRETLGLKDGWAAEFSTWQDALRNLFNKVDEARILLVVNGIVGNNTHRKLDVNEFRGFVLVDEYAPLIFINGADGKAAQMFTLAHELAHIWYGSSAAFDLRELHPADNKTEIACNKVAAEFLVPGAEFLKVWPSVENNSNRFQQLARQFKVSEIVAARRALDLKKITSNQFFEFYYNRITAEAKSNGNGGNFYSTQNYRIGRRFGEAIITATKEGKILYNEAYRLTGLNGNTFAEFASRLGFGGDV